MLCLAEIVLDGRWFSVSSLSIVLSLGLGFQFRGSSLNLLVIFPLIPSTMSSAFFSNAVPKACAAIPTMASSFFVRRTFVFLQV